ncbi:MAG: hypothetical protein QOD26_3329 [Betaproteobacteria bacterium]|jgi:hypothetical protein|nr:hypothetical protein [Betaproteobacteria bacterium]
MRGTRRRLISSMGVALAARTLGVTLPRSLLVRADRVIE